MKEIDEIRNELLEIRFYFSHKSELDTAQSILGPNRIIDTFKLYQSVLYSLPPKLYHLFYCLYILGYTQEALSNDLFYTLEYINRQNKLLLLYLQENI